MLKFNQFSKITNNKIYIQKAFAEIVFNLVQDADNIIDGTDNVIVNQPAE